jgi:hypothetical protein
VKIEADGVAPYKVAHSNKTEGPKRRGVIRAFVFWLSDRFRRERTVLAESLPRARMERRRQSPRGAKWLKAVDVGFSRREAKTWTLRYARPKNVTSAICKIQSSGSSTQAIEPATFALVTVIAFAGLELLLFSSLIEPRERCLGQHMAPRSPLDLGARGVLAEIKAWRIERQEREAIVMRPAVGRARSAVAATAEIIDRLLHAWRPGLYAF